MAETIHVLVVEDDPDVADFTRRMLARQDDIEPTVVDNGDAALRVLESSGVDLLFTDVELPGMSGLTLIPEVRRRRPGLPVIVATAHSVMDYAVEALRQDADEFYLKPVDSTLLVTRIRELVAAARKRARSAASVLAVGAHPDDVEIGVGGILARHAAHGDRVSILTLSGGGVGGDTGDRAAEAAAAAAVIGASLDLRDFPDTRLDPAAGLITAIEEVIAEVRPSVIYTHTAHDRHQDHRAVHRAVEIAARRVPAIECFESPSVGVQYQPNRFVPIDDQIDTKLRMIAAYASQGHRNYMEPDLVRATARYWSRYGTTRYAEPLETLRVSASFSLDVDDEADPLSHLKAPARPEAEG
ncbi:response regulator [Nocardioides sp. YIM 152588]|uniref:response regulator n=1 Tax=Nocardioides sp. YIM 152588 TaxID=3158259 RepID=UPI0032E4D134